MSDLPLNQQVQDLRQGVATLLDTIAVLVAQVNDCDRHLAGVQQQLRAQHGEISALRVRIGELEKRSEV